jgi:hypothetical protein
MSADFLDVTEFAALLAGYFRFFDRLIGQPGAASLHEKMNRQ